MHRFHPSLPYTTWERGERKPGVTRDVRGLFRARRENGFERSLKPIWSLLNWGGVFTMPVCILMTVWGLKCTRNLGERGVSLCHPWSELGIIWPHLGCMLGLCWGYTACLWSMWVPLLDDIRSSWWYLGGLDRSLEPNGLLGRLGKSLLSSVLLKLISGVVGVNMVSTLCFSPAIFMWDQCVNMMLIQMS